jgi:hydrogenase-4 membrane subunit HyfE
MLIAVSAAALLLGLLVLSTANRTISQIIGVLRVDNAIALFELGSRAHEEPIGIRIGKVTLVVASLAFYRWYLAHVAHEDPPPTAPGSGVL